MYQQRLDHTSCITSDPHLSIGNWGCEQLCKVLVTFLVLVLCLAPLRDGLSVEDEDVEESVQKEDDVGSNGNRVEEDRLRRLVECV
jgi:hypothetical protein